MELLEIAKANAAKALGTANFDLPASLRAKEASQGAVSCSGPKTEVSPFRKLLPAVSTLCSVP